MGLLKKNKEVDMYRIGFVSNGYISLFHNETQMMLIEQVMEDDSYNVVFKDETGNDMDIQNVHTFEAAAQLIVDEINGYLINMQKKAI